jgi:PA14 domain/FlgD Ig-like domain
MICNLSRFSAFTRLALLVFLVFAALSRAAAKSYDISFRLKEAGQVSVAVYDAKGKMLRELSRGTRMEPGEHRLMWDGLDRYGKSAAPGEYEWRLLRTPGFTREFLVNVATNPGWAPFDLWPGNHRGPTTLMVDSGSNLYVGSPGSEGPPHIVKISADGRQKFWGNGNTLVDDGLIGMARIGELVYVLYRDGTLDLIRADTGKEVSRLPAVRNRKMRLYDLVHPNDPEANKKPIDREKVSPMVLAGGRDFLVVTYEKYDDVRFFQPKDGGITLTKSVHVAQPKGCCIAPDGHVFVVSGKSIVLLDPETGNVQQVVSDRELVSPTRLTYESVNDDLLVIQHDENLDHVRRYHASDGKLVAVYGRVAGRVCGDFNPLDFGDLLDIVADGEDGFFTAEEFPRRVAHFRGREHHELVTQWFGGMRWGSLCSLDPADPTIVYSFPDTKHCAKGRIDYATRTWTLTRLYNLPDSFSWVGLGRKERRPPTAMFPNFGGMSYWEVRHVGNATFLVNNGRLQGGCAAVARVDEQHNRITPVAFLGGLHPSFVRTNPPPWWLEALKRAAIDPVKAAQKGLGFSWSDTNRNGNIDVDEIRLGSVGHTWSEAHCFVDRDWNVYRALAAPIPNPIRGSRGAKPLQKIALRNPRHLRPNPIRGLRGAHRLQKIAPKNLEHSAWVVIPNEGQSDLPVWNWDHARDAVATYPQGESELGATSPLGIFHDKQGNTYTVCNTKFDWNRADVPPLTWPNSITTASRFEKWNSAGTLEWSVGLHTSAKDRPPGEFTQVRGILGELGGCLVVLDACEPASVWTRDGLYVGSLYADRTVDGLPHNSYKEVYQDDNHWGLIMQTSKGDVLWGGMSHNSTPLYRIRGWDNWERQSGKLTVEQPSTGALWKGNGLQGEYFTNMNLSGEPSLRRTDPDIWFGPIWGAFRQIRARTPWFGDTEQSISTSSQFSARWQGFFEVPFSEEFTFIGYTYGRSQAKNISGSKIRLWVNGQLIIDEWKDVKLEKVNDAHPTRACVSTPIFLNAGQRVPLRLEYAAAGGDRDHLHLYLACNSLDERHVPSALLYLSKSSNHAGQTP